MNLVEVWFCLVERQAVRRGVFKSVRDLNAKIRAYIDGWNDRAHPFVWTKTAEQILKKANRPTTSNPRRSARRPGRAGRRGSVGICRSARCGPRPRTRCACAPGDVRGQPLGVRERHHHVLGALPDRHGHGDVRRP